MSVRIATFNVENLMARFDFSGYRNQLQQDRALSLFEIKNEDEYRLLEQMRVLAHLDDTRQLSALAIADTRADIVCLQEVDTIEALNAFEFGYLFKMIGSGYRHKYLTSGNDMRGIDVAVMMRDKTRHGEPIEFTRMTSHAHLTFEELDLFNDDLRRMGLQPHERIFKRDCLELDIKIAGKPVTLYTLHLKSMGGARNGQTGRDYTMPIRVAETRAVRRIIENRFGASNAQRRRWVICGDFNDYRERIVIRGDLLSGFHFTPVREAESCLDVLLDDGFAVDPAQRLPELERWSLYHTRGPEERHLCQLDYVLLSPALARTNPDALPEFVRSGQPFRAIFPPGQETDRYPRTGWDRPKASDHCPVVVELDLV